MYRLLVLLSLPVFASAAACEADLACMTDADCDGGAVDSCVADPTNDPMGCCPEPTTVAADTTTTTVATVTVTNSTTTTCVDLLNPVTGVSDCPARASLCNDSTYYDVMTQQCPLTCGRCSTTNSTSSGCVDLTNANTGISDCAARKAYCNNTIYQPLMKIQCPATCGFCTSG